jgi:hypothetical protein
MNKNNNIKYFIRNKQILTNNKYALLIGISDYKNISDLNYCDEDIQSWCNYLNLKKYNITVLGDGNTLNTSNCKYYKNLALEYNVKLYLNNILLKIKANDTLFICTSGHGYGDSNGKSFICLLDQQNYISNEGSLYDYELIDILKKFNNKNVKLILFFDNCFSGGMLDEINKLFLTSKNKNICATSTCTFKGYGFDNSIYKHGQWTYFFLNTLINKLYDNKILNTIFNKASNDYIKQCKLDNINKPQIVGNKELII